MKMVEMVCVLLDICMIYLYFINPILCHELKWISGELVDILDFSNSLCITASLAVFRVLIFTYLIQKKHFYATTRCVVVLGVVIHVLMVLFVLLQFVVYFSIQESFMRYKKNNWTKGLFIVLTSMFVANGALQMWCIVELNKTREVMNAMERDIVDRMLLGEGHDYAAQKLREHNWAEKWRAMTKRFTKQHDPIFARVLRLYAHQKGSIQMLNKVYEQSPKDFEFYIPQLCSFLLLGQYNDSPHLYMVLLEKCSRCHMFAHRMRWFLKSFCVGGYSFASTERKHRVSMLIEEVEQRGIQPAQTFAQQDNEHTPLVHSSKFQYDGAQLKNTPYSEEKCLYRFMDNVHFMEQLGKLSSRLITAPHKDRNEKLREQLGKIQSKYLPSANIFVPVGNAQHRVKGICADESFIFSTKERVPYLLCLEVIDDQQSTGFGKRFTALGDFRLSIFDKEDDKDDVDKTIALTPDEEGPNLGFWGEYKRQNSITESLSNSAAIFHGLMDKVKAKNARQGSPTRSNDSDITSPNSKRPRLSIESDMLTHDLENGRYQLDKKSCSNSPLHSPTTLSRVDSTDAFLEAEHEFDPHFEIASTDSEEDDTKNNPRVVFLERWKDKENRIRKQSTWGNVPGWRLLPVIVKSNDDLRQEQFASQLILQFYKIFSDAKLPVWLRPYDVVATNASSGIVEAIADTISIDSLKRNDLSYTSLLDFFVRRFGSVHSSSFHRARSNFIKSLAAYSIVCYLLQIKDRHNGNILLHAEGYIAHIDFGFILANNPGNMHFESAPFKLTKEFVQLMGGPRSASFRRFRSLCVRSFLVARKYRHRITLLVEMMIPGNEQLPCFAGNPRSTVDALSQRFKPELDTTGCENFVHTLIDQSLHNWRTTWYDKYQRWCVGVF